MKKIKVKKIIKAFDKMIGVILSDDFGNPIEEIDKLVEEAKQIKGKTIVVHGNFTHSYGEPCKTCEKIKRQASVSKLFTLKEVEEMLKEQREKLLEKLWGKSGDSNGERGRRVQEELLKSKP